MAYEWEDAVYACLNYGEALALIQNKKEVNLYQWRYWSNIKKTKVKSNKIQCQFAIDVHFEFDYITREKSGFLS